MPVSLAELAADMADMEELVSQAKRPKVRAMLSEYLQSLRDEYMMRISGDQKVQPAATDGTPKSTGPDGTSAPALATSAASTLPPQPPPSVSGFDAPSQLPPVTAPPKRADPGPPPVRLPSTTAPVDDTIKWTTIPSFGWDQDTYGVDPNFVYVYIMSGVDGVGEAKERVTCDFTKRSFDLKILDFGGKNLRLRKDNLDKDIMPEESKVIVKKNRVTIKMKKPKGQYGHDSWLDLTQKRPNLDGKEKDPGSSLMDMMKDMYDNGDDTMKKTLGARSTHGALSPPRKHACHVDSSPSYWPPLLSAVQAKQCSSRSESRRWANLAVAMMTCECGWMLVSQTRQRLVVSSWHRSLPDASWRL